MAQNFFEKINYSASNEDSGSELKALNLNQNDIVLCITGSGARSLDLLIALPQKIVSIDFNATQNYLLNLKLAAYDCLNYEEFCQFIGLKESKSRRIIYEKINYQLDSECLSFWNNNLKLIENGILYCGNWERFLRVMQKFSIFRKNIILRLFQADNLEIQQEIWHHEWDNWIWRAYLKLISNRFLWVKIIKEPGAKLIPKDFDIYSYMKKRMDFMAANFLLKKNHFANLIFNAKYTQDCLLPHHLRPENFEIIKQNLARIEIVTDSLEEYLADQKNQFTAFSLSDFSSYAPELVYNSIWEKILHSAQNEAKFCERQFLVKANPALKVTNIMRNTILENELNISDDTAIYSFCAGKIIK